MEEWIIIILLIMFVIMFLTLKPVDTILFNKPQTQLVQCQDESIMKDLVILPNPNPVQLTKH